MIWSPVLAISVGAAAGALLRWQLGVQLNSLFPVLPLGTLAANLVGGYIIGLAIAYFAERRHRAGMATVVITGFCGGLTTFSTFSAEVVTRLQEGRMAWAMGAIAIHVTGSLMMTLAGLATGGYWNPCEEQAMNGYQITFFTHQDRRHKGKQIGDWLMHLVQELGLRGASLHAGGESFARGGRVHSAHFFELADQPVEVLIAVTSEEATRLFDRLKAEGVHLFYVKTPVEFGVLGREP